jgi:hypothetical protein
MKTTTKNNVYALFRSHTLATLTPASVADEELEWYFTMAESDLGARSNYLEMLIPTRHGDSPGNTMVRRAMANTARRTILARLTELTRAEAPHAGVLQAAYTARPWPLTLRVAMGRATGIAVRLASADLGLPDSDAELDALERETAESLDRALARKGAPAIERWKLQASARYAQAFRAYERVRGDAPSAVRELL